MTRFIFISCLLLLSISACIEPIVIETQEEKKLVVNATFSPEQPWTVFVTKPKNVLDRNTSVENIIGAKVTIFENNMPIEVLEFEDPGLQAGAAYRAPTGVRPMIGRNYSVQVEADGYPVAIAADSVPLPNFSISNLLHEVDLASHQSIISLSLVDQSNKDDYYQISLLKKTYSEEGSELILNTEEYVPLSIKDIAPLYGNGFETFNKLGLILDDQTMPETIPLKFKSPAPNQPGTVIKYQVEVRALSVAYYTYQKSIVDYLLVSQNPLAHPFEIYSNVINGAGNFTGYSKRLSQEVVF